MLKDFGGAEYNLTTTEILQDVVISLPIHTELTEEELNYITTNVNEIVDQLAG